MMEREYIQKLLDNYMAAETTREEEQFLSDYFRTHRNIPAEWRVFSILFRGISQYKQKPDASYMRPMQKWVAAAAIIAFVFGAGLLLTKQEETNKPSEAIVQTKDVTASAVTEFKQETIAEEPPVMAEVKHLRSPKLSRPARKEKSTKQKSKDVKQMMKLLDEADMAFSQAAVQCAIDIEETIPQNVVREETESETIIII